MKRRLALTKKKRRDVPAPLYEILPHDLWPCIFVYLRLSLRYRYATVCKAWSETKGLIDQSVESLENSDCICIDLSRFVNVTRITTYHFSHAFNPENVAFFSKKLHTLNLTMPITRDCMGKLDLLSQLRSLLIRIPNHGGFSSTNELSLKLSNLTKLSVSHSHSFDTGFTPVITDSMLLASATTLVDLELFGVRISNDVLLQMTALKHLAYYCDRQASEVNGVAQLTNLCSISIGQGLNVPYDTFSRLTNLTSLKLRGWTDFEDRDIANLTSLASLSLSGSHPGITRDVLPLFQHLTRLMISESDLNDDDCLPEVLFHMTQLKKLSFAGEGGCAIYMDEALGQLTQLTSLRIFSNKYITTSSISCLTNLRTLHITCSSIEDHMYRPGLFPVSLRKLDLSECKRWHPIMPALCNRLTNLVKLSLGRHGHFLCDFRASLVNLSSLRSLDCISSRLTSVASKSLSNGQVDAYLESVLPYYVELRKY